MGGRTEREDDRRPEREDWIQEVSDDRLARYDRLMDSSGAPRRVDGSGRIGQGEYFRDLIDREKSRRNYLK